MQEGIDIASKVMDNSAGICHGGSVVKIIRKKRKRIKNKSYTTISLEKYQTSDRSPQNIKNDVRTFLTSLLRGYLLFEGPKHPNSEGKT